MQPKVSVAGANEGGVKALTSPRKGVEGGGMHRALGGDPQGPSCSHGCSLGKVLPWGVGGQAFPSSVFLVPGLPWGCLLIQGQSLGATKPIHTAAAFPQQNEAPEKGKASSERLTFLCIIDARKG